MIGRLKRLLIGWLALVIGVVILSFSSTWWDRSAAGPSASDALFSRLEGPHWVPRPSCRARTDEEERQAALALQVLGTFDRKFSGLAQAAIRYFSQPASQSTMSLLPGRQPPPCAPVTLYGEVAEIALRTGVFDGNVLGEDALRLAGELGPRDERIVQAVARTAFYGYPILEQQAGLEHRDVRAFARTVLAGFGPASRPWMERAIGEISGDSQLGTTAAQIAIAAGDLDALPKVQQIMERLLRPLRRDRPIPYATGERLRELAYALGMAGSAAQPFSTPLADILEMRMVNWFPFIGWDPIPPRTICPVADRIGGTIAAQARTKEFCLSNPIS